MDFRTSAAQDRHNNAMKFYDKCAEMAQTKNCSVRQLLAMPGFLIIMYDFSQNSVFRYMGRFLTEELLSFILKERETLEPEVLSALPSGAGPFPHLPPKQRDVYGFSFITGSPGAGKTCSLLASVFYLYTQRVKDKEALAGGVSDAGPSSSTGTNKRQRLNANKRIVFLEGLDLAESPETTIWNALFQTFLDDREALAQLEAVRSDAVCFMDIDMFLKQRAAQGEVILVVDDGNKVDRSSLAASLLSRLLSHCKVVFCASVSRTWIGVIRHSKATDYKLVGAAMNDTEYVWYKYWFQGEAPISKTGRVPRLMWQFSCESDAFEKTISLLEQELRLYFSKIEPWKRRKVLQELTGVSTVGEFPDLLDTKCFYKGDDGRLKCLSSDLQAYALSEVANCIEEDDLEKRLKEIDFWCAAVCRDDNIVRIAWNAELATILTVKFLELEIPYATDMTFALRTIVYNRFEGQMDRSKLSTSRPLEPTCHAPTKFAHSGLDFYYEDKDVLAAVQVSVGLNAEYHHKRTVEKAEEIFRGDKRTKVLLWVVYTDQWSSRVVKTDRFSYFYVTMPFVRFSQRLLGIDDTLKRLRNGRGSNQDVCHVCMQAEGGNGGWVQCDFCDSWYHLKCVMLDERQLENTFECHDCYVF